MPAEEGRLRDRVAWSPTETHYEKPALRRARVVVSWLMRQRRAMLAAAANGYGSCKYSNQAG